MIENVLAVVSVSSQKSYLDTALTICCSVKKVIFFFTNATTGIQCNSTVEPCCKCFLYSMVVLRYKIPKYSYQMHVNKQRSKKSCAIVVVLQFWVTIGLL